MPDKSELKNAIDRLRNVVNDGDYHHSDNIELLQQLLTPAVCRRLGLYSIPDGFLLSVIVPIYNEVKTLETLVERVLSVPLPIELVLVDDGSTDGTREILEQYREQNGMTVLFHPKNRGKGAAIRSGLAEAKGDVVVIQDADLEYDPTEFPLLLQPILQDEADVVYGSRFSSPTRRVPRYWHSTINRLITLLSNMSTNLKLTDVETCYKLVRRKTLEPILPNLKEEKFGIEIEITAKLARVRGIRFYEMPIAYNPRTQEEGKKIGWRDGLAALWCILKY